MVASENPAGNSLFSLTFLFPRQIRWLQALAANPATKEVPAFSDETNQLLDSVAENWGEEDAGMVKKVERVTNHDVKAIEYVLKEKFEGVPELKPVSAS